jgi:uncharacterized membrane protein YphA (DoxX/SURF4 family)
MKVISKNIAIPGKIHILGKLLNMRNLSAIGRIFYGISIAAIGFLTICYKDFPYMMIPPKHGWLTNHPVVTYIAGAFLLITGACIAIGKAVRPVSLLLGTVLLLVFCFYFVPYELFVSGSYSRFSAWENAAKELTLASGAVVIAGRYPGIVLYALTIISYSIDHFIYGSQAADYIPAWIPGHVFWIYFAGAALLGAGIGILLNIRREIMATLLGTMIFIWVVILHIPKAIANPADNTGGEVTSLFLALAYCGIAFVIAAAPAPKTSQKQSMSYAR